MVGTARYISPEAAEGKPVDGRADVYSLALVLYEAVTGTCPFCHGHDDGDVGCPDRRSRCRTTRRWGRWTTCWRGPPHPTSAARLDAAGLSARLGALAARLALTCSAAARVPALGEVGADRRVPGARGGRADRHGRGGGRAWARRPWWRGGTMVAAGAPSGRKPGPGRSSTRRPSAARRGRAPVRGRRCRRRRDALGGKRRRTWVIAGVALAVLLLAAGWRWRSGPTCSRRRTRRRPWRT